MYRKKNFISLGMSLVLAAGITVTPVTAADFTDGTVPEFNSDDATEFDVQQETADNAEFASDTEDSISDKAGSNEADSFILFILFFSPYYYFYICGNLVTCVCCFVIC